MFGRNASLSFGLLLWLTACSALGTPSAGDGGNAEGGLSLALSASPASGPAPLQVRFESDASSPAGGNLTYTWRLANRTFEGGANRSHTFVREGSFDVGVTASDGTSTVRDVVTVW